MNRTSQFFGDYARGVDWLVLANGRGFEIALVLKEFSLLLTLLNLLLLDLLSLLKLLIINLLYFFVELLPHLAPLLTS